MPSEFSREQVAAIAAMANLDLDPTELDLFARQLGAIIAYADEVMQVETSGIPPTLGVETRPSADRPDEARPSLAIDLTLRNAPESERRVDDDPGGGFFFKVPRVIG